MRILIVGLNYTPEPVGIGPYTAGLAEALVERGHRVTAIAGKPYYPQWRGDPAFAGGWKHSVENGVALTRCPHYIPAAPTGPRRILHLASFALSALGPALRGALTRRPDRPELVIAIAPALLGVLAAWLAAKLAGARLWVHLQDFEVEAAVATGLLGDKGPAARLALWVEARILLLADKVSTISPQMCARLLAKGVAAGRVIEIRNWSDTRFRADATLEQALRARWGLLDAAVCLYSGNIARKQGIEVLVEAARMLAGRSDIVFVICGEGPNRAALEALAAGLPNLQLHDLQPAENMGAMLALARLHLLPQIAGAADLVLPSKLTNMLASGRPVIATTEAGTGLASEIEGCGLITPPGDAAALAAAIVALVDDPPRCAKLGETARQRAVERWDKMAVVERFEQAALALVAPPQG
ncbi:MAG TPA: WcaI family glycosyltransferase [Novosphingobium sp.]|nr:WcaI family glycosyltransferase [Novosphingobium sp.]